MTSTSAIILGAALIIIMFGMGLSLTVADFKRVLLYPKAVIVGLINQLIILPAIGFALIWLFPVKPDIAIGLIILAACPGGPTSNLITHLAKGDTALSVSLTAISSTITVITIPFIVNLGLLMVQGKEAAFQLDVLQTIGQVFIIVIIPVSLGMLIKARQAAFADRMDKPVRVASGVVFTLVIVGILIKEKANIIPYFQQAGVLALSIETGIQTGTLAISIATVLLGNSAYAIAPAIYGLLMFFTAGIVIFWGSRRVAAAS